MNDFSKLLKNGLLDEATSKALKEAFDAQVAEKLEEERENLREEFARKSSHDKSVMIEAADKMFNDTLNEEIELLRKERLELMESKIQYKKMLRVTANKIEKFATKHLHEEIKELRTDRKIINESLHKFNGFAIKQLSEELAEFHQDKKDLVETKVKLISEMKSKIAETKSIFVKRAAKVTEAYAITFMTKEMKSLHKDIKRARQDDFGRRIFEAFGPEYMNSSLSDGSDTKRLMNAVKERDAKLDEQTETITKQAALLESTVKKSKIVENRMIRSQKLNTLMAPLSKSQKELMSGLLENVQTSKLGSSFKKHLNAVLNKQSGSEVKPLKESKSFTSRKEVTGDKVRYQNLVESEDNLQDFDEETSNITRLQKLAGIKNK